MTFDGSAIDGFSRVRSPTSWRVPTSRPSSSCPGTTRARASRGSSATSSTSTAPPSRAARASNCAASWSGARARATPSSSRPRSSTSTSRTSTPSAARRDPIDRGSYFDLLDRRRGQPAAPTHRARARGDGHRRRARPARGRPRPARDRPALHRRPDHGRHRDDGAPRGQGARAPGRRRRPASCPSRSTGVQGSGMHTHLSLWRDERNAFVGEGPYGLSEVAHEASSPGRRAPRPEITAITNQWVNSYKRLMPGVEAPVERRVGAPRRRRPGARALGQARARSTPRASSTARPTRRPTPTCAFAVILAAGLRGVAGDYELARRGQAGWRPCPSRWPRRSTSWRDRNCCSRPSASTRSSGSCATSAPSGTPTAPR